MSVDIERLKVDRGYWDEVAPEGAAYYITVTGIFVEDSFGRHPQKVIHRPTKQEWSAMPIRLIGELCEVRLKGEEYLGRTCEFIAINKPRGEVWLKLDGNVSSNIYPLGKYEFRPLKTPEQRLREELVGKIVSLNAKGCCICDEDAGDLADAILSCYSLSEKE